MSYLLTGIILGVGAALSPGPLLALVISETLRYGTNAGIKTAIAPLITDIPIIFLSLFLLSRLEGSQNVLGLISICGAVVICSMGLQTIQNPIPDVTHSVNSNLPLIRGVIVNLLNPHPYLFWFTVGGPLLLETFKKGKIWGVGFLAFFYGCLVGPKIILVIAVDASRGFFIRGKWYALVIRLLGCALCILGIWFFLNGLQFMGVG